MVSRLPQDQVQVVKLVSWVFLFRWHHTAPYVVIHMLPIVILLICHTPLPGQCQHFIYVLQIILIQDLFFSSDGFFTPVNATCQPNIFARFSGYDAPIAAVSQKSSLVYIATNVCHTLAS